MQDCDVDGCNKHEVDEMAVGTVETRQMLRRGENNKATRLRDAFSRWLGDVESIQVVVNFHAGFGSRVAAVQKGTSAVNADQHGTADEIGYRRNGRGCWSCARQPWFAM